MVQNQVVDMPITKQFKQQSLWIVSLLVLLATMSILPFSQLNALFYDHLLNVLPKHTSQHVVVVAIDDKSLETIGRWPWSRAHHASLLTKLKPNSPTAIGFDLLFIDEDKAHPADDLAFAHAISEAGNVVLPVSPALSSGQVDSESLPLVALATAAKALGHNDVEVDPDGKVRTSYLHAGWQQARWPSFALALAQLVQPALSNTEKGNATGQYWTRQHPLQITFNHPQLPVYSFVDVVEGRVDPAEFKQKIVLVGITAHGLGERFSIPAAEDNQRISGVELTAYQINTLINGSAVSKVDSLINHFVMALILLLSVVTLYRMHLTNLIWGTMLVLGSIISLSIILFVGFNYWFEPVAGLSFALTAFMVLSIQKAKIARHKIEDLSQALLFDQVTDLPNSHWMEEQVGKDILSCEQHYMPLYLVIVNVGRFKSVNDLLGFKAGNHVLSLMAKRIKLLLMEHSKLARNTGPEFTISIQGHTDDQIKTWCEQMFLALSEPFSIKEEKFRLPISIGISSYPEDGMTVEQLYDCATVAMHRAKEWQERGVCYYHKDINQQLEARMRLERELAMAIENNQIEVHYQPQISAHSGDIIGIEALARWRHPVQGLISPEVFIPVAEATGAINDIGDWIIQRACCDVVEMQKQIGRKIRLGVNLSAVQFLQPDIVDKVMNALQMSGLAPECLELELTESCLVQDIQSAENTLQQLKQKGIKLSIDDFGTGYSSLSYLKHFSMDRIKIDRSFVSEVDTDGDMQEITAAILVMAKSLNMSVIAEGVESLSQIEFLQRHACEEYQGFYFSQAVDKLRLIQLLREGFNFGHHQGKI